MKPIPHRFIHPPKHHPIVLGSFFQTLIGLIGCATMHAEIIPDGEEKWNFLSAEVTEATNRSASVDATKFLDPALPDCGIQAAIDAVPASGGEVILPSGEWVLRQGVVLRSGIVLRGQGPDTRLLLPDPIVTTKLTKPIKAGDQAFEVEDATAFSPGMDLAIGMHGRMIDFFSWQNWTHLRASIVRVKSAEGSRIVLAEPLPEGLPAMDAGAVVANFFPMIYARGAAEIEIRDLVIDGRPDDPSQIFGDYVGSAITLDDVARSRISGVKVLGWKGDGISWQKGAQNLAVETISNRASGHPIAKGFHPGSVQDEMILSRCAADGCAGPGIFFCREVKFSVIGNSVLKNNGEMIGGFAAVYDTYNICNRNYGEANVKGVYIGEGGNHVFVGNTQVGTQQGAIEFVGDKVMRRRQEDPNWWPKTHVVASNTVITSDDASLPLILIRSNTSASVIANNALKPGNNPLALVDEAPKLNVVTDNHAWEGETPPVPSVPPVPPALPAESLMAAYKPGQPDCGFQSAIDKVAEKGGVVRLPAGRYVLKQGLVLPSNVTLCGAGRATQLIWEGEGAAIRSEGTAAIAIRQMTLRQHAETETSAIVINNAKGVLLESVLVDGFHGTGIELTNVSDALISQCLITDCGIGCVVADSKNFTFAESWSIANRQDGVLLRNSGGVIDSSIVSRNGGNGVTFEKSEGLSILSSVVARSIGTGISLTDAKGTLIHGSIVQRGNEEINQEADLPAGIRIAGNSENTRVFENLIRIDVPVAPHRQQEPLLSIQEAGDANNTLVQFNVVPGQTEEIESVLLTGSDSKEKDNILKPSPIKAPLSDYYAVPAQ